MAIELGERFWSKVNKNADNGCWEWTGAQYASGYGRYRAAGGRSGKMIRAHRASYEFHVGEAIPGGMMIDHMCWNRLCVNPDHLRLVDNQANQQNRASAQRNSKTGVRGVSRHSKVNRYEASARLHGRKVYLGLYETVGEAEAVVKEWRQEHMPYSMTDIAA